MSHRILVPCLLSATLALTALPAHADRDMVQFGSNINVAQGESIHDAVCFFCSVNAQGTIDHDVVVFFGDVHIAGHSDHDIVDFFGDVRADDNASIGHDIVNFFGDIRMGENVSVGNDMVVMFGAVHTAESVSVGGNRVVQPAWLLLIPLIIFGGIVILIASAIQHFRRRQMYAAYPFPPPPHP
jgi:hypothetical protein